MPWYHQRKLMTELTVLSSAASPYDHGDTTTENRFRCFDTHNPVNLA